VLQGLRASPADVQVLQGRASVAEGQSIVATWQESGLIIQVFPLHETNALTKLQISWVRKLLAPQPLGKFRKWFAKRPRLINGFFSISDDIATYFGVKVALYFAWLGHYTCALCVPAVLGTILWAGLWGRGQVDDTTFLDSQNDFDLLFFADGPRHWPRNILPVQRGLGVTLPGGVASLFRRTGI
jgi:anoctamin-8